MGEKENNVAGEKENDAIREKKTNVMRAKTIDAAEEQKMMWCDQGYAKNNPEDPSWIPKDRANPWEEENPQVARFPQDAGIPRARSSLQGSYPRAWSRTGRGRCVHSARARSQQVTRTQAILQATLHAHSMPMQPHMLTGPTGNEIRL